LSSKSFLFIIRRFSVGGSQVNLLSIINELDKRNYTVSLMSDNGALINKLPDKVKWYEFPLVTLRHPNLKFYIKVNKLVKENDVDYIFSIDPILSLESYLSYFFHKKPVYGFITAQNLPHAYTKKWPTIFVNKSRELIYQERFKLTTTYYVKERLDTNRFLFNYNKSSDYIKVALISRLDPIKKDSIDIVLNFFKFLKINSTLDNYVFFVYGGGNLLEYYKENYESIGIIFKGEIINIEEEMYELNVVFGMASTLIQSMASNCISVVVGDKGIHGVVNQQNVEMLMANHFNIHNNKGKSNLEILNEIESYVKNSKELGFYKSFVDENYSVSKGVDKIEDLLLKEYKNDSFIYTLYVILKLKIYSLFERFKK
jgi:hypothetical protein